MKQAVFYLLFENVECIYFVELLTQFKVVQNIFLYNHIVQKVLRRKNGANNRLSG